MVLATPTRASAENRRPSTQASPENLGSPQFPSNLIKGTQILSQPPNSGPPQFPSNLIKGTQIRQPTQRRPRFHTIQANIFGRGGGPSTTRATTLRESQKGTTQGPMGKFKPLNRPKTQNEKRVSRLHTGPGSAVSQNHTRHSPQNANLSKALTLKFLKHQGH